MISYGKLIEAIDNRIVTLPDERMTANELKYYLLGYCSCVEDVKNIAEVLDENVQRDY